MSTKFKLTRKLLTPLTSTALALSLLTHVPTASATEIDDLKLEEIIDSNTDSATNIIEEEWISHDGTIEFDSISNSTGPELRNAQAPLQNEEITTKVIEREDGYQLVTVSEGAEALDLSFEFADSFLEELPSGHILVRPSEGEEPTAYIDPAWAQDADGNHIDTRFSIEGDTLVQHIAPSPVGTHVVSDPYIRDVRKNGRKIGQELVFTRDETSIISLSGLPACIRLAAKGGPVSTAIGTIGCGGALLIASHANNTGRCLTLRAIGSPYAPNLIFPYATSC